MMVTGMISANNFILLTFFIVFSAFSYECVNDGYVVFHKSEQSNEVGKYYNEISYKLVEELESRCLYIVSSKSVSPIFIGSDEIKVFFEVKHVSSEKNNGGCELDYNTFIKKSLVFSDFELDQFKDIESKVHGFISGDDFKRDFLIKFDVTDFYVFSFENSNFGNYIMSVLADGVVYDVLTKLSNGSMEIDEIKKSPGINL